MAIPVPFLHDGFDSRFPSWVNLGIFSACLLIHLLTATSAREAEQQAWAEDFVSVCEYFIQHPHLTLPPKWRKLVLDSSIPFHKNINFNELVRRSAPPRHEWPAQQETLDQLVAQLDHSWDASFIVRWGYTPIRASWVALFAHMFLHANWTHLMANMVFLLVVGPALEDAWGHRVFAALFLLAGVFGLAVLTADDHESVIPVIGASGAVSGLMGAFLVRFAKERIGMLWAFGPSPFFVWVFRWPAWFVIILWLVGQLVSLWIVESGLMASSVAFRAHLAGFAFGLVAALAIRATGYEERRLAPAIEKRIALLDNPAVDEADRRLAAGRPGGALNLLRQAALANPANATAVIEFWRLARQLDRPALAAPALAGLVARFLRSGSPTEAMRWWLELRLHHPAASLPALERLKLLEEMTRQRLTADSANLMAELAAEAFAGALPPGIRQRLVQLAEVSDPELADRLRAIPIA